MADAVKPGRRPDFLPVGVEFHCPWNIRREDIRSVVEALLFYGYEGTYGDGTGRLPAIERDLGVRARDALERIRAIKSADVLETDN